MLNKLNVKKGVDIFIADDQKKKQKSLFSTFFDFTKVIKEGVLLIPNI